MENKRQKLFTLLLLNIFCISAFSQAYKTDSSPYIAEYEIKSDKVFIRAVYNKDKDHSIIVYIDGQNDKACCGTIRANGSLAINKDCYRWVKVEIQGGGNKKILDAKKILPEKNATKEKKEPEVIEISVNEEPTPSQQKKDNDNIDISKNVVNNTDKSSVEAFEVLQAFKLYSDTTAYYSNSYYSNLKSDVNKFVEAMKYMDQEQSQRASRRNRWIH